MDDLMVLDKFELVHFDTDGYVRLTSTGMKLASETESN